MPIYEYCCEKCEHVFEEWQKDFEDREMQCPECNGASRRLISNTAFILKGSGWYVTDYARGNGSCANGGNGTNEDAKKADGNGANGEAKASGEKAGDKAAAPAASASKDSSPAPKKAADKGASAGNSTS